MRIVIVKMFGWLLYWVNFRFFYRICRLVGWRSNSTVKVDYGVFELNVHLNDPYWVRLISKSFRYESEIEKFFLEFTKNNEIVFVDCGANIGYWSIFMAKVCNVKNIICVEANPKIIDQLKENLDANNLSPTIFQCAIGDSNGNAFLDFYIDESRGGHAGSSLLDQFNPNISQIKVPVKSLNEILGTIFRNSGMILVKLDIEGAEEVCVKMLDRKFQDSVIFVYEDHGHDRNCRPTRWLLESGRYTIFLLNSKQYIQIRNVNQLLRYKRDAKKGYNLIAYPKAYDQKLSFLVST